MRGEESFFERRYVGDQAGPGLIARVVTQYEDVAVCGHVLHEAEQSYEFFRKTPNVDASHAVGLAYLKQHFDELRSGNGLTKKNNVAKHGDATAGDAARAMNGATSQPKRWAKKPQRTP